MNVSNSLVSRLLAGVLVAGMAFAPIAAIAQRAGRGANNPARNLPVTGTVVADSAGNPITNGPTFTGTFDVQRFEAVGDQLLAVGELNGQFSNGQPVNHQAAAFPVQSIIASGEATGSSKGAGRTVPAVYDPSRPPTIIRTQAGTCDILTLVLGPLHLDLLGLVVDLDTVDLRITAQQGSGNLLGNLLCAVAGLLDGTGGITGPLTQVAALLSQIVNILNGVIAGL